MTDEQWREFSLILKRIKKLSHDFNVRICKDDRKAPDPRMVISRIRSLCGRLEDVVESDVYQALVDAEAALNSEVSRRKKSGFTVQTETTEALHRVRKVLWRDKPYGKPGS